MKKSIENHFGQCQQAGKKVLVPEHGPAAVEEENDRAHNLENDQTGENQVDIAPLPQGIADNGPAGGQLENQHDCQGQNQQKNKGREGMEAHGLGPMAALQV